MSQFYFDPERESDPHALPDGETFYVGLGNRGEYFGCDDNGTPPAVDPGWYYQACFPGCFPGCLPDSEPIGPYPPEEEAIVAAREE